MSEIRFQYDAFYSAHIILECFDVIFNSGQSLRHVIQPGQSDRHLEELLREQRAQQRLSQVRVGIDRSDDVLDELTRVGELWHGHNVQCTTRTRWLLLSAM